MARRIAEPAGSWGMQIEIPYPMGLEQGGLIFTRGQCDHDPDGKPQNLGNIAAQIAAVVGHKNSIWSDLAAPPETLVRLVAFYNRDAEMGREEIAAELKAALGPDCLPTLITVPLEALSYPGLDVEIDFWGNLHPRGAKPAVFEDQGYPAAVQAGDLIYIGAQLPLLPDGTVAHSGDLGSQLDHLGDRLAAILAPFGAGCDDIVKLVTYFVGDDDHEAWGALVRRRASWFDKAFPVVTDVMLTDLDCPGACVQVEGIAVSPNSALARARKAIAPGGLSLGLDDHPHPPAISCGPLFWTSGQLAWNAASSLDRPGDLVAQTGLAMERIGELLAAAGLGFGNVVKVNTYYRGGVGEALLHANMEVRNAYYRWPGPGSTGVPVLALPHQDAMTSVEVMAIAQEEASKER